ncbi:TonB family protein [Herbaspirillum sp. ST 5-3]|uniref:TonB family protein n=1 Tax=Oxalobacteraceae TaxID=75682 RepID=UPI0010A4B0BA|nr:TonB family protein [Herbaspirillum sp. ST 5-3]
MSSPPNSASAKRRRGLPMSPRTRLGIGILASLLVHGLILSMQFGVLGLGLPGLELPWSERRVQAGLSVRLTDVKRTPEVQNTLASSPSSPPVESLPPAPETSAGDKHMQVRIAPPPRVADAKPVTPARKARRKARTPPRIAQSKPQRPKPAPDVIALNEAKPDSLVLPAPAVDEIVQPADTPEVPAAPAPEPLAASTASTPDEAQAAQAAQELEAQQREEAEASRRLEEQQARQAAEEAARKAAEAEQRRAQEEAVRRAEELEASRVEEARRQAMELEARRKAEQAAQQLEEARRQEEARAMQQQLEARRQAEEAALRRQEEQRVQEEAARRAELEAKKRDEEQRARREAMEREARLQAEEAARQQAEALARQKQAEQAAMRQQAEAAAAQAREQERLAAENAAAAARAAENGKSSAAATLPKAAQGGDLASRALDQARRPAPLHIEPRAPAPVADAAENPRRRSIFGGGNLDVGLMMYIESWRLKIERNGRLNYSQTAKDKARGDPIVTVSIRSDGSVEDVVINRSSGRPELDAAVRRIIKLNERYAAFPPNLARQYDVIDIRRVWNFDEVLRILEEVR